MKHKRMNTVFGAFRLLGRYQPSYYACMIPLIFVSSVIPLVGVWLPKMIIEFLTTERKYGDVLALICLYIAVLSAANVARNLLTHQTDLCVTRFKSRLQLEIGKTAMHAEMREIESAVYKEEILVAGNVSGLTDIMRILQSLFSSTVTILGLAYIIVRMNLLFFLLVGVTLGIKVLLSVIRFRRDAERRLEEAANNKVGAYLDQLQYYAEGAAKEVRVNNARGWLSGKIRAFRERMVELQMKSFHQYRLFEAIQSVAVAIQNVCILLALAGYYMAGSLSIADFSLYFSAVTLLSSKLSEITDQMLGFSQKLLSCRDFNKVSRMEKKADNADREKDEESALQKMKGKEIGRIRFEKVSFSYPGTSTKVLEDVSFELRRGDRAMLAGYNGSGKTTVIKLLCRFYEPDSGNIYVDDTDISTIPREQYYSMIAAAFQDFSVFSFPVSENISMRPKEETETVRLWNCLKKTEVDTLVGNLPHRENTYITRLFSENGVEFSGGERQRLGIARALYKDAQILVLDEPAASLDIRMEEELYRNFYHMTAGKISLTVSHRLSQASVSNKIFVLDHGVICESGTHDELMRRDGIYAAMFKKQREVYKNNSSRY